MLDDSRMETAIALSNQAAAADDKGDYAEALKLYTRCLDNWMLLFKYQQNQALKDKISKKMEEYLKRAETIKGFLKDNGGKNPAQAPVEEAAGPAATKKGDGKENKDEMNEKLKASLESAIVAEKPNVKWADIAGLQAAKDALQETVIMPTRFPQLFEGNRKPWRGILLYGPPGTGKTYLAKACATEADSTFFSISSSDLVSKWMGESEKLVRNLFEMARAARPAIIFIDEVDSMCGGRESGESDASRRIKTEFLVQMQGVGNSNDGILVLGATNTPWDLDSAIRRRFERRVYIPLPEQQARVRLLELNIGSTPTSLTREDILHLGARLEGFSGADVSILVRAALFEPVKRCRTATHFKQVPSADKTKMMWTPCSPADPCPSKKEMGLMDIPGDELLPPMVSFRDFEVASQSCRPSVGPQDLVKQEEFTKLYGMEG